MYPENRPSLAKWVGVAVGFIGIVVLFYPFNFEANKVFSMGLVMLGGFCFALALNMIKKLPKADGLVSARNVLVASLFQLFILGFLC